MPKKRLKMGSSTEVKRAVNRITNMLLNGEIDARTANALLYGCNVCLGAIRVDDQQAQLNELERMVKEVSRR
jgi:hypothetical protein